MDEFKGIIMLKYSFLRYIFVICWYILLSGILYLFINNKNDMEGLFGSWLWSNNYFQFIALTVSLIFSCIVFMMSYIVKYIVFNVPDELTDEEKTDEEYLKKIAILIPCHNSEDVIEDTIKSIIKHFPGENIYVADNNKIEEPTGDMLKTKTIVEKYNGNYFYFPIPNKTNAIKSVMSSLKDKYEYCILLDDDTLIGEKFCLKEDAFLKDPKLAGIGFGIRMKETKSILQKLIDYEYLLWSYSKYTHNFASSKFICGIGGIWRMNIIEQILNINPADGSILPYGEDGWNGLISRLNGYRIKHDFKNFVYSFCPDRSFYNIGELLCKKQNISGYGASNLWKQRALRWYRSGTLRNITEWYSFFTYNASVNGDSLFKKIVRNIYYRIILIWSFFLLYLSIILPLLIVGYFYDPVRYSVVQVNLIITSIISGLIVKFLIFRKRDDMNIEYKVILLYPFYVIYLSLLRMFGVIGTVLFYFPFKSNFRIYSCHRFQKSLEQTNEMIEIEISSST